MLEPVIKTLLQFKEKELAIEVLDAFEKRAWSAEEYNILAKLYFDMKEYIKSAQCGEKVLVLSNNEDMTYCAVNNLINVYNHANEPEIAMRYINQCEQVNPNDIDILLEKSYSHFLLNEKDKAESILHEVYNNNTLTEDHKGKIRFNLGTYYMYKDKFQEGLRAFLIDGKALNTWKNNSLPYEYWDGSQDISGRAIILMAEAGIGDEVVNIRFMKHLEERGAQPIWYTERKDLAEVFNRNLFYTITSLDQLPKDIQPLWTYSMQVPIHLNLQYEDLYTNPYLQADNEYIDKWELPFAKPTIGLRWQGNPDYDQDLHRGIPLRKICQAINHLDAELISLQRDSGVEEGDELGYLTDYSDDLKTWDDTMGLINNLEVVVTSCTSIAHMSAAMGKRTFVFVPISSYYTWCHSMEKSPWYGDNVTLLRQVKPRDWTEPIQQLKEHLTGYINRPKGML